MEYLVPLVIVLVIIVVVIGAARYMGRKGRAPQDSAASTPGAAKATKGGPRVTRELAAEASAKLTPEAHRAVYSLIARRQVLNAVQTYRKATGTSLGNSAAAVAALAEFPQPSPEPAVTEAPFVVPDILQAEPEQPAPKPAEPQPQTNPSVPPSVEAVGRSANKPSVAGGTYRYRAIVSRGDEVREVASTRLNEELFGRIRSLARSGDLDGAVRLLCDHADVSDGDAREFVSMIGPDD